mgnify:CR=1 FL=1
MYKLIFIAQNDRREWLIPASQLASVAFREPKPMLTTILGAGNRPGPNLGMLIS